VVDVAALANDIVANAVSLALPGVLWALLFVLAWEHAPFAESIGFGRWAFWLLLPGSILASFAILPFGAVSDDIVAVSFGGAIFPIFVGLLAFGQAVPPLGRNAGRLLAYLAVESAALLALVLPFATPLSASIGTALGIGGGGGTDLLVVLVAAVATLVAALLGFGARGAADPGSEETGQVWGNAGRPIAFVIGLTSGVLATTFAISQAIPGVGIIEPFPLYLLPPIAAGALSVLLASRLFPRTMAFALPFAFLATTFGVLVGADLLRQPPLYGSGPAGLYTIGGAGVLDLVYLSGLLALAAAYATYRLIGAPLTPVHPVPGAGGPRPFARLARAFRSGTQGHLNESVRDAAVAGHEAAQQAQRLLGLPVSSPERPWEGLAVPGWVVSDQANLDAIARSGTTDGREGFRAWITARWLVLIGRELGQRRFAPIGARCSAFLLDLAVVGVPAVAVWIGIVLVTPGGLNGVLSSLPFNAAIYAFVALAFLFFVVAETRTGTSPGKRWLGLAVRNRTLEPVGFREALVRNCSLLPLLTVLALGGALVVAFGIEYGSFANVTLGGIGLPGGLLALAGVLVFLVGGVGLLGGLGVLTIAITSERQRLGDVLAGTWVVRAASPTGGPVGPGASPAPPPPPAAGRSV
jgi:uncharacterized membrane protein/uncharacterized RDD family membrane protein YckC